MNFKMRDLRLVQLAILPIAVSLFSMSACGGDNNSGSSKGASGGSSSSGGASGSGGLDTGLPGDKPLDGLTPDEQKQLCDKTEAFVEQILPQDKLCALAGVLAASIGDLGLGGASGLGGAPTQGGLPTFDPQACKDATAQCLAAPTETTTECNVPSNCTVTVAEYEACLNDAGAAFGAATRSLPKCDNLSLLSLAGLAALANPPSSCDVVDQKCPGALDGLQPFPTDMPVPPAP